MRGQPTAKQEDALPGKKTNTLQTLDRGLQALTIISEQSGMNIAELANQLDVDRAIAYRLVATLEAHGLVARGTKGSLHLGAGLLTLASRFEPQLRRAARPVLHMLANETNAAAFIAVPQGEECVAIMVAEPEGGVLRVTYRVGSRHPLTLGAAGIAILAGRPERPDDPAFVREARKAGFSVTRDQLQRGAVGIACPLHSPVQTTFGIEASLGVVAFGDIDIERATVAVLSHADRLTSMMDTFAAGGTSAVARAPLR
jgi:DNA-binding IclR family transcriptional regulator